MFEGLNSTYSTLLYFTEEDYEKYVGYIDPSIINILNDEDISQYGSVKFSWKEFKELPDQIQAFIKIYGRVVYNKEPSLLEDYANLDKLDKKPENFDIFSRGKIYYFLDHPKNEKGEIEYNAQDFEYDIFYLSSLLGDVKKKEFGSDKLKKKVELSIADHILNLGVWLPYITLNAMAFSRHKKERSVIDSTLKELIENEDIIDDDYVKFEEDLKNAIKFGEEASDIFVSIVRGGDYNTSSLSDNLSNIDLEGILKTYPKYRIREGDNPLENYMHSVNVIKQLDSSDSKPVFDKVASILWSGATVGSILASLLNKEGYDVKWSLVKYSSHEPYLIKNLGKSLNEDLGSLVRIMYNPNEAGSSFEKQIKALERFYINEFKNSSGVILADDVLGTGRTLYLSNKLVELCGVSRIYPTVVELSPHALDNSGSVEFVNQKGNKQIMESHFGVNSLYFPPSFKHISNKKKSILFKKVRKQEINIGDIENLLN